MHSQIDLSQFIGCNPMKQQQWHLDCFRIFLVFLLISVAFDVSVVEAFIVIVIVMINATINGKLVYITTKRPNISIYTLPWRPCAFHIIQFHLFYIFCDRLRRRKRISAPVIRCESITCLRARAAWTRFVLNHISYRVQLSRLVAGEKTNQNPREREGKIRNDVGAKTKGYPKFCRPRV